MSILQEAELWVFVGLILFFALLTVLKVPGAAGRFLDARGEKVKAALDEAQRLRDEANELLTSIKAKHAAAEAQASQMIREAELEAERLAAEAHEKLQEQIARRTAMADRRISTAEAQAALEVKAAAVEIAATLAEKILADRALAPGGDPLVDRSIPEVAARLA